MATIKDVNLNEPVELMAYRVEGIMGKPVERVEPFFLSPTAATEFIEQLSDEGRCEVIEDTLQSLVVRNDGTNLLTALPPLIELKLAVLKTVKPPNGLIEWLNHAKAKGTNEVIINFVTAEDYAPGKQQERTQLPAPATSEELQDMLVQSYGPEAPERVKQALKGLKLQAEGASASLSDDPGVVGSGDAALREGQRLMAKYNNEASCLVKFVLSKSNTKELTIPEMNEDDALKILLGVD